MRAWTSLILPAALLAGTTFAPGADAQMQPSAPAAGGDQGDNAAGHGSVSIAYFNNYSNDFLLRSNFSLTEAPGNPPEFGVVHMQGMGLDVRYNLSNDWTIYGGINYFTGRYNGLYVNCPTTAPPQCAHLPPLDPQHPEAPFVDDGNYHGAWQDWHFGVEWHAAIDDYFITPSATAYIPTHDYPTFGNPVVGQNLSQLLLAVRLEHQFELTDFYYRLSYGYAFSQHVLGIDTGYQRADGELGWFVNERFSVNTFVTGRAGFGVRGPLAPLPYDTFFYERQRTAQHDYHAWGLGLNYDFGNRYSVSANVQHEFWGDTVYNFVYALEARLTRSF